MNGATTEPLVSTTSPPNTTIMIRTGNSQNFFLTRINRQSSATKSMSCPLELISHRLRRWTRRLPHDPVAVGARLPFEPQQVLPHHAHDQTGRQNRAVENQRHQHRAERPVKQHSELQPYQVKRMKDRGAKQSRSQRQRGQSAVPRPPPSQLPSINRSHCPQ